MIPAAFAVSRSQSDEGNPENEDPASSFADGAGVNPELADRIAALPPAARSEAIVELMMKALDDDKAEDIVRIDLDGKSDVADAMIIASGRSQRHVAAVADHLARRLKEAGLGSVRTEGLPNADWVLLDAGDVIVHVFRPEVRAFYNLERIWSPEARAEPAADRRT